MSKRDQLDAYLKQVEKRLRLDALLRGAAILTSVALVATVALVLATNALAFSGGSVTAARAVLFIMIAVALGLGLVLPVYALNRHRAARRLEAALPEFQQRLVTFVDRDSEKSEPFIELLADDTLNLARKAEPGFLVPDRKLLASVAAGVACLGILVWMIVAGPGFLGYGAARLWAGSPHNPAAFYDIRVSPGDAVVRRNATATISAQLVGFESSQARLYARYRSASKWEAATMQPQSEGSGFQFFFASLPEDVDYYVEAGLVRSRHFKIRVVDLPSIKQIRVTYHYPAWTGLRDVAEERGGDLRAVEGTEAELSIFSDMPLRGGVLVLDNQQQIALNGQEGNVYQGAIRIERDGQYHVAALDQGQLVRLSDDFFIEADKANPPEVSITRPGADYRASPIEEVTVSVTAHDDYALKDVTLHYSVNGGPPQTVEMLKQKGAKAAEGSATLYLEDFKLVPGDVVSVYATAKGSNAESHSNMSFIQAEPFEREYSQSQVAGGGDGNMGGQEFEIAQREKEIIGATWQQQGDTQANGQQAEEAAKFLSGVQGKLRAQALTLAGRLQSRELSEENEEFSAFQKDMNAAAEAMGPASENLKQQQWSKAIPSEEKALQHLLRAEATFRQIQVAFGGQGGGGSGAGAGGDLSNLLNLELDTEKNQYETGQTAASASQRADQIDKALQKLDELARRQQDLANQQQDANNQSAQQRWQQEMLRREAEQLQKQMEQLAQGSRQGQQGGQASSQSGSSAAGGSSGNSQSQATADQRIQRALDQLRQANDDMRRASSQGQSAADARRAADRLQQATRLLGGVKQQQGSGQLDSLAQEADRLAAEQHSQAARVQQKFGNGSSSSGNSQRWFGGGDDEQSKLADSRQLLASDLSRLEKATQDAARQLGSGQREAASKLQQALGEMDGSNLQARLQHSAQAMRLGLPPDTSIEQSMSTDMDRFNQRIHEAQQALKGQQQGPEEALERVERLRSQIDALTRNLGGSNAASGRPSQSQNGQSQQSATAQQSQGGGQQGQGAQQSQAQSGQQAQGGGQGQQAQGGQQGQQAGGQGGQSADAAGGFQPGGPGGPRVWQGGMQNGLRGPEGASVGGPGIETSDSPASTELTRQRALRELDGLRQDIRASAPDAETDAQNLMRDLQRLGPGNYDGNPELVDQLRARVLAAMDNLELRLRRDLDQQESGQVRNGDSLRVPQGYQESVAEYFRRLSKNH
jgi:hypothetical protein